LKIDQPGKDSFRLRGRGRYTGDAGFPYRRAVITEFSPPREVELQEQLASFLAMIWI